MNAGAATMAPATAASLPRGAVRWPWLLVGVLAALALGLLALAAAGTLALVNLADATAGAVDITVNGQRWDPSSLGVEPWSAAFLAVAGVLLALLVALLAVLLVVPLAVLVGLAAAAFGLLAAVLALLVPAAVLLSPLVLLAWLAWRLLRPAARDGAG